MGRHPHSLSAWHWPLNHAAQRPRLRAFSVGIGLTVTSTVRHRRRGYEHTRLARGTICPFTRLGHLTDYAAGSMPMRSANATADDLSEPRADLTNSTATPRVSGEKGAVSGEVT